MLLFGDWVELCLFVGDGEVIGVIEGCCSKRQSPDYAVVVVAAVVAAAVLVVMGSA